MTWRLREYPFPFTVGDGIMRRKPGEFWRIPLKWKLPLDTEERTYGDVWEPFFSPEYKLLGLDYDVVIKLPGGTDFRISHASSESIKAGHPKGWLIVGELPNITVEPSINVIGYYHGWIRGGELSDDIEGRQYDDDGKLIRLG